MTEAFAERVPTGGSVVAPRYEEDTLEVDEEVAHPRDWVPSQRERLLGRELSYRDAVEPEPPRDAPLWDRVKAFVREADPREITRDAPKFPLYWAAVSTALGAFDFTSVLGPEIQQDIGLNFGIFITLGIWTGNVGILLAPIFGYLADHVRRVILLRTGTLIGFVGKVAQAASPTPGTFIGAYLLGAADSIVEGAAGYTIWADYYPVHARVRLFTFLNVVGAFFGVLGPAIAGPLGQALGWREALIITNSIAIFTAVGVFFLKEPVRGYQDRRAMGASEEVAAIPQPPMSFGESWRAAYSIKTLRRSFYALPFFGIAGVSGILQGYYFYSVFHLTPTARGLIAAISAIPAIPLLVLGGVMGDRLLKRSRPGRIILYSQLLSVLSSLSLMYLVMFPNLGVSIALGFAFSLPTYMIAVANQVIWTLVIPARFRGTGGTASAPWALAGNVLAGFAFSYVYGYFGMRDAILLLVPFGIVGSLILVSMAFSVEEDIRRSLASSMAQQVSDAARRSGHAQLLVIRGLDVHYGGTQVVFNLDLDVEEGEVLALLGTNGSGKSTVLKTISGLMIASNGAIYFDGVDVTHQPPHEQAQKGIVMVPGGRAIFPTLTVRENLRAAGWIYRKEERYVREKTAEVLEMFPILRERLDTQAGSLSGGEQQMLCLSQAFLMRPRLLMVDELTLGLAPQIVEQLLEVIRRINTAGTTVILVEQSINLALTVARRCVFMEKGQVRFDGPTAELLSRPDVARSVFLGEARSSRSLGATRTTSALAALQQAEETYDNLLEIEGVSVAYGGVNALTDVSLEMKPREILGVIGPNGAGKTTLFDVVSGFVRPPELSAGRVVLAGRDITDLSPDRRHHVGLCRSFQNVRLFSGMTARETIAVAYERHLKVRSPVFAALWLPHLRQAEAKVMRRVDGLIEVLGLGSYANKFMDELSTGSRRLVEIACLLAAGPKLLLLDEPSSGLAQAEVEELGAMIHRIRQEAGCGILVVEHDLPLISGVVDRLVAMDLGRVIATGAPDAVMNDPQVIESYLGVAEEVLARSGTLATAAAGNANHHSKSRSESETT